MVNVLQWRPMGSNGGFITNFSKLLDFIGKENKSEQCVLPYRLFESELVRMVPICLHRLAEIIGIRKWALEHICSFLKLGGLKDTVIDPGDAALMQGEGTGFAFHRPSSADLHGAVFRAANLFRTDPEGWKRLQKSGMQRDFSWGPSAEKWKSLYVDAIGRMAN